MQTMYTRTEKLIGIEALKKIKQSSIIIFGLGGVGSYVAESLARAGVGNIALVDNDIITVSNLNRQLFALHSTMGKQKTTVAYQRLKDINNSIKLQEYCQFYDHNSADKIDLSKYDYIVDAIDTVSSKLLLIERALALGVPIISSMGTGNKLNPLLFEVADINKTSGCPLARVMRQELKKRNINNLKVVYSKEPPVVRDKQPSSISFIPSIAGLILTAEVIKDIINYGV